MGKGGGGTTTAALPPELVAAQHDLIRQSTAAGQQAQGQEATVFNQVQGAGNRIQSWEDLFRTRASNTSQLLNTQANILHGEGINRSEQERGMLHELFGIAPTIQGMGTRAESAGVSSANQMAAISPQMRSQFSAPANTISNAMLTQGTTPTQIALAGQMRQGIPTGHMNNLSGAALTQSLNTQAQANRLGQLGNMTGTELDPLRSQSLDTLNQVAQGQLPTAVQSLFTDAGGARERDILELQTQAARNQMIEGAGAQGGGLNRNLGALETNRMLGLAGQEARRTDQQRALSQSLFGMATEQGLTSPQQQAQLLGQSGQLIQSAEGLRQGSTGLAGQLTAQGEQMRQAGMGAAGGLYGQAEQQRIMGLTGGADVLGQSEQMRQTGLGSSLSALDMAANRDMQSRMANAQLLSQSQGLYQSLAEQYGAGGDALRLASPSVFGQSLAALQGATMAPSMAAGIYQGAPMTPASSYYGAALGGNSSMMEAQMQAQMGQQQMQAQNNAGLMNLLGSLGAGAMFAFT